MDELTDAQRAALVQLRDLTNGADDDVSISVLSTVDWDVQRAAELIFGGGAPPPPFTSDSSRTRTPMEIFDIDDGPPQPPPPARPSALITLVRPLFTLLTLPLHVLTSLVRFLISALRLPIPTLRLGGLAGTLSLGLWGGSGGTAGRHTRGGGAARWVRELEEETGAVSIGRGAARGTTSGVVEGSSSSGLTARGATAAGGSAGGEEGRRLLPDFMLCTYEEFLRSCSRDARVGCVVLVSEEHDDVAAFKRSTLIDPAFVQILTENEMYVWGGDVRDHDAWSASEKLQATTYPFVAFLALQPRRTPGVPVSSTSSPPSLTVLSRHQGPSIPSSGPTSADSLTTHLTTQLLPRVRPFLGRLQAAQREREAERALRAQQDAAFASAAQRDKDRIEAAMARERAEREERQRDLERQRRERERQEQEAREEAARALTEERKRAERMVWRRWTRRVFVTGAGPGSESVNENGAGKGGLRMAIRLPSGARILHTFNPNATLTTLYALIDAALIPADFASAEDPVLPPGLSSPSSTDRAEAVLESRVLADAHGGDTSVAYWGFRVASPYPRTEIAWKAGTQLVEVDALRGGGQLVVELVENAQGKGKAKQVAATAAKSEAEDDGYDTEESE